MTTRNDVAYERIHPETVLGPVHYNVADVSRTAAFYRDIIGMKLLHKEADFAVLGTDERQLLRLTKVGASGGFRSAATTGLYHTAFLVPTKRDLAYLTRTLIDTRTPVHGTSDHGTHLAIYLPDPEGNGIELAWDHPKEQWPMAEGRLDFLSPPRRGVDVEDLLRSIEDDEGRWFGVHPGTMVGHIHLHVADLDVSKQFYNECVGFDVTIHSPASGASFLSAGGYHHHVGMNIWKGRGLPPPPPDAPGLRYFTVVVPTEEELGRVAARIGRGAAPGRTAGPPGTTRDGRDGFPDAPELWVEDPSGLRILFIPAR